MGLIVNFGEIVILISSARPCGLASDINLIRPLALVDAMAMSLPVEMGSRLVIIYMR